MLVSRPSDLWQRCGLILSCSIHLILEAFKTYLQISVDACERNENG